MCRERSDGRDSREEAGRRPAELEGFAHEVAAEDFVVEISLLEGRWARSEVGKETYFGVTDVHGSQGGFVHPHGILDEKARSEDRRAEMGCVLDELVRRTVGYLGTMVFRNKS